MIRVGAFETLKLGAGCIYQGKNLLDFLSSALHFRKGTINSATGSFHEEMALKNVLRNFSQSLVKFKGFKVSFFFSEFCLCLITYNF